MLLIVRNTESVRLQKPPGGRKLLGGSNPDSQSLVPAIYSFETKTIEKISDYGGVSMAWLQDVRRALFVVDGTIVISDTLTKKDRPFLTRAPDRIIKFSLSKDNRWLYYILESVESDIWLLYQK